MSYKPTHEELIDYLYGSLPTQKVLMLEQAMVANNELRQEVESLQSTLHLVHKLPEEEVLPPVDFSRKITAASLPKRPIWWPGITVAASLMLVMLVGYVTQTRIKMGSFELSFGNVPQASISLMEVQQLVKQELAKNNATLTANLTNLKTDVNQQLVANKQAVLQEVSRQANALPKPAMETLLTKATTQNKELLANYLEVATEKQKEYIDAILVKYMEYIDEQRKIDFKIMQANMEELDYKHSLKNQQNEELLQVLLTNVEGSSMGQ